MSDQQISSDKAKQDKQFYVVANIIIINITERTCLILKRSDSEKVLPGKYAFPGGKLEHGDVQSCLMSQEISLLKG